MMMTGGVLVVVVSYPPNLNYLQAEGACEGSERKTKLFPDGFEVQIQWEDRVPAHSGKTSQKDCLL